MGCNPSKHLECPICKQVSTKSVEGLIRHVNASHTLKCRYCQHSFDNGKELIEHHTTEHEGGHIGLMSMTCPKCQRSTTDEVELVKHLEDVHNFRKGSLRSNGEKRSSSSGSTNQPGFLDPDQPSITPTHSQQEMLMSFGNEKLACPICHTDGFYSGKLFVEHLHKVHEFTSRENLFNEDRVVQHEDVLLQSSLPTGPNEDGFDHRMRNRKISKNYQADGKFTYDNGAYSRQSSTSSRAPLMSGRRQSDDLPNGPIYFEDPSDTPNKYAFEQNRSPPSGGNIYHAQSEEEEVLQVFEQSFSESNMNDGDSVFGGSRIKSKPTPSASSTAVNTSDLYQPTYAHVQHPPEFHNGQFDSGPAYDYPRVPSPKPRTQGYYEVPVDSNSNYLEIREEQQLRQPFNWYSQDPDKRFPVVGDVVLASGPAHHWEFFKGSVTEVFPDRLEYKVQWGNNEQEGGIFENSNIALDRTPSSSDIGVGTLVLFPQGQRHAHVLMSSNASKEGLRWHQGIITKFYRDHNGIWYADGAHTKGENDGKFISYSGYKKEFEGFTVDMLRLQPNPFDIMGALEADNFDSTSDQQEYDIFFSCQYRGNYAWFRQDTIELQSLQYQPCDPIEIAQFLKGKGFILYIPNTDTDDIRHTVRAMRRSKVFVACVTNEYAASQTYSGQFHYAKSTLNMPIIPLLFEESDEQQWKQTSIGLLVANSGFIHFENKGVQDNRQKDLIQALQNLNVTIDHEYELVEEQVAADASPMESNGPEVFISYAWSNSYSARQLKQVNEVYGTEYTDPRLINSKINGYGLTTWIDVKDLDARQPALEQIAHALKSCQVVVPFISTEYGADPDCIAVLKYVIKSLHKPVIPVVVGQGDSWKDSVVGSLLAGIDQDLVNIQYAHNDVVLNMRLRMLKTSLAEILSDRTKVSKIISDYRKAPRTGERVIGRYGNQDYRYATVERFDRASLEYTVTWENLDPANRILPFDKVALDLKPATDEVGIGTVILVQQKGSSPPDSQVLTNSPFLQGVVSKVTRKRDAVYVDGYYVMREQQDTMIQLSEYRYEFSDISLSLVRLPPTALDVVDVL